MQVKPCSPCARTLAEGPRVVEVLEPETVRVLKPVVLLSQDAQCSGPVEGTLYGRLQRQARNQVQVLEIVPVVAKKDLVHGSDRRIYSVALSV